MSDAATPPADRLARLDLQRRQRLGMVEAVWGEHKSPQQIAEVITGLRRAGELALVTRVSTDKEAAVRTCLAAANQDITVEALLHPWTYEPCARLLMVGPPPPIPAGSARVGVLCAGSSDLPVALEAQLCLRAHGMATELIADVGVAGLHRLLAQLERLQEFAVLIVCAGMEGALPTVVAGLVPQPVIGVPVAVGYGVSAGGRTALEGMLASCAPGLCVVNIDNGYGAGMAALRLLNGRPGQKA
ncbi:nickel pincer cofactor biosynthesis protein LarB [Synechococcus sp. RSCCF101]|uniref:nickel pincer cofactor biosynthesis protein LarB n=1 Tax=Synechococcus sp. RSCCF101 TaxID=2511069 RepID=UPI00124920E4|nr:nickel pincer cofactor biosynthesis protein LarB [Synechococcus sp. RSCCF101]QEY31945.1 nickel pincer cofactor biosynthesis protein LarB [Synechococcus sp. RSCCF101]